MHEVDVRCGNDIDEICESAEYISSSAETLLSEHSRDYIKCFCLHCQFLLPTIASKSCIFVTTSHTTIPSINITSQIHPPIHSNITAASTSSDPDFPPPHSSHSPQVSSHS